MKVGDRVTVVHGSDASPGGVIRGVIVLVPGSAMVQRGMVAVRPAGAVSGYLWFPVECIDTDTVVTNSPRHRVTDPDTAVLAAEAVAERLTEHQWAVLSALVEAGTNGLIDHEHEARNGLIPTSAGKRRKELELLGLVAKSGRKRPTATGQLARVWCVTARGVRVHLNHQQGAA